MPYNITCHKIITKQHGVKIMNTVNEKKPLVLNSTQQIKLPETQTISDKQRLIEHKKENIASMKKVILAELKESEYNEIYVKRIADILNQKNAGAGITAKQKAQNKEDLDLTLRRLVKSDKVSSKCKRAAQIILDEQDGIERAQEAIVIFKRHAEKSSEIMARMRAAQQMFDKQH